MRSLKRIFVFSVLLFGLASAGICRAQAQQVHATPGKFDYYLMNLSWAPEFCHNVDVLPAKEKAMGSKGDSSEECSTPHGFVLHGMWPQNFNGTYPANCSHKPGPKDYTPYLKDTPSETLLRHEWSKHGTCTTFAPDAFFKAADHAFEAVKMPSQLQNVTQTLQMTPDALSQALYQANPAYPKGSIVLACGNNALTAISVCLSKTGMQPVACQHIKPCSAKTIKIAPETHGQS